MWKVKGQLTKGWFVFLSSRSLAFFSRRFTAWKESHCPREIKIGITNPRPRSIQEVTIIIPGDLFLKIVSFWVSRPLSSLLMTSDRRNEPLSENKERMKWMREKDTKQRRREGNRQLTQPYRFFVLSFNVSVALFLCNVVE